MPWWLGLLLAAMAGALFGVLLMGLLAAADSHRVVQLPDPLDDLLPPLWVDQLWLPLRLVPDTVGLHVVCNSCLQPVVYAAPGPGMPYGAWDHVVATLSGDHPARAYLQAEVLVDQVPPL